MASPVTLGHSGGAVPDSHRVPWSSAARSSLTDHQRTLNVVENSGVVVGCKVPRGLQRKVIDVIPALVLSETLDRKENLVDGLTDWHCIALDK